MARLFEKSDRILRRSRIRGLQEQWRRPGALLRYFALKLLRLATPDRVPLLPATLDVEPNNYCNFRCPHCQVTHWSKPRHTLDLPGFRHLLDQLSGLTRIKLQGMGEPLLSKEFLSLVEEAERRGISVRFVSNGSVMTPMIVERLAALKRTIVVFSLDGASAGVFEKMRPGSSFERVVKNIENFGRARAGPASPPIAVNVVVTRANVGELHEIVALAHRLGARALSLQLFLTDWGKQALRAGREAARVPRSNAGLGAALREAREVAERLGVELSVENPDPFTRERPCPWPWESAYVASNGDVVPCCMIADSDVLKMGNVFEQDFAEIWNGDRYRELRRRMREHDLHDFCRACYGESDPDASGAQASAPENAPA